MSGTGDAVLWFEITDLFKKRWKVYLVTEDVLKDEFTDYRVRGLTVYETGEALICAEPHAATQDETMLHELMHIALWDCGLNLQEEEAFISKLSPRLWPMLRRLGFSWPERPHEYKALKRRIGAQ